MLSKYTIEYSVPFRRHAQPSQHHTDDPVALKEFLEELLDRDLKIISIRHEGVDLPRREFDKLLKDAAGMLAARHLCHSLGISSEEERTRFGFTI